MSEEETEYFNMLNNLYEKAKYIFSKPERKIIENMIDNIINWSEYFLKGEGEDNE